MFLLTWTLLSGLMLHTFGQQLNTPRGPWRLAFKVIGGKWDAAVTGYSTFWDLFTSTDTYTSGDPVQDARDFTTSGDHYKSEMMQQWEDGYISVQAIKMAFFKNSEEKANIVFNAIGKTKTTWFKCNNILHASFTDLPDSTLGEECPGRSAMGYPLTIMKISYWQAPCTSTTGWLVVTDTNLNWAPCPDYMPSDASEPLPNFKYSSLDTVADLTTQLETADSMAIFFQVWDIVFKGIEGKRPSDPSLSNLTGLFISDLSENDDADMTVRNLQHSQSSLTYKSQLINMWDSFHIDMVKFAMFSGGVEKAYVVFDGVNGDKVTWFSEDNILFSSYGNDLDTAALAMCSIEGDTYRNWQIQSANVNDGCTEVDQLGWMLVKEPRNNGTCSWDTSTVKKPYFLYNTGTTATSPENFQYADVIAVFVHGWRIVLKLAAGGSLGTKSSVYALFTETGTLNDDVTDATSLTTATSYKSAIIDQWEMTTTFIRAVKLAAYKDGLEVFSVVFDGTASTNTDWLDCKRLIYTSVSGLDSAYASTNSYTCSVQGSMSTFRFLLGTSPDCGAVTFTGVFAVLDSDSGCSSRTDLPQFLFTNTPGTLLSDVNEEQLADLIAVFVDMDNCYGSVCNNGGTCQDIGGNFRCFCAGSYYGTTCSNLDGSYNAWTSWSTCSVTCADGVSSRTRVCVGAEGDGLCIGASVETVSCSLDPCPIHGGYSGWGEWSMCTLTCGSGTQYRTRDCNNPTPQYGGNSCVGDSTETTACNTNPCPIDGAFSAWGDWSTCSVTCADGTQTRVRTCTNPEAQYGGADCTGDTTETQICNDGPCPVDGGYTSWSLWNTCSLSCGDGSHTRSRTCTEPTPQYGGAGCIGSDSETQMCNDGPCPVDGGFSAWSEFNTCSVTCSEGIQTRTRTCTNPEPANGGGECIGDTSEIQICNEGPCPVDGGFSVWGDWTTCSVTCADGTQTRARTCTNPVPAHGGADCVGETSDSQICDEGYCPVDGGFSIWSVWTTCSVTCADGSQTRARTCTNPAPAHGGSACIGDDIETQSCNEGSCPVDGGFSVWSDWTTCSVTCADGSQTRVRTCTNPFPLHGGSDCTGDASETQSCNEGLCPVDGGFSIWSDWTTCSVTCADGSQTRARTCTNPAPAHGGSACIGDDIETQSCNEGSCPVDGGFSVWSDWTTCSVTCADGSQTRARTCTNPVPSHGGSDCTGDASETQTCNEGPCPVDGGFSIWADWTTCSVTCADGSQTRARTCTNPAPAHGGSACIGDDIETQSCNEGSCPVDGGFSVWSDWTTCSVTCADGSQTRTRTCTNPVPLHGGSDCTGDASETQICNEGPCPVDGGFSIWADWTTCSVTCAGGSQTRARTCTNPLPTHGGSACIGDDIETQSCNEGSCPVDGGFSVWSDWTTCSVTCADGSQTRARTCTNPEPAHGGADCVGETSDLQTCNEGYCPVEGGFSIWGDWTTCSVTCADGTQTRARTCTNPIPAHGGTDCVGDTTETQSCNEGPCPVNGGFSSWGDWATCTVTCADGSQTRARTCTNPVPAHGGTDCVGDTTETQSCNEGPCPMDGGFSIWSDWTTCSVTCADGTQTRVRTCTNPEPTHGGAECIGETSDLQTCNEGYCPVDGGFSIWGDWTTCSVTCADGSQTRARTCTNPVPAHVGLDCVGDTMETETCNKGPCPMDGGFSIWSNWSSCSVTCADGTQTRERTCTNPEPAHGGADCVGETSDSQACNEGYCPVDGLFSPWVDWTTCSVTCADGTRTRVRTCTNPSPAYGGTDCTGEGTETQLCTYGPCPINGGFTSWNDWTTCSVTCAEGTQTHERTCTNPIPAHGGADCAGDALETQQCNEGPCPVDGGFSTWGEWTTCSVTCDDGTQTRARTCTNPEPAHGGSGCLGDTLESQACNDGPCPVDGGFTDWSDWASCSVTCSDGTQSRVRTCTNPVPVYGGLDCTEDSVEIQSCNEGPCPVDGGFTIWADWATCSTTCADGTQSRTRTCTDPAPANGGSDCIGDTLDSQVCNLGPCPEVVNPPCDPWYDTWTEWITCSVTCAVGTQTRTRACNNPEPLFGGAECTGDSAETQNCNLGPCPVDGGFTLWTDWGTCSVTCDDGTQTRTRTCTNPEPQHGGMSCIGDSTQSQTCNDRPCPIDGSFSTWGDWLTCTTTCGDGAQTRLRTCTNPEPQNGGVVCTGDALQSQACNEGPCPVDGDFSAWSNWIMCSVTCADGTQTRERTCTNPVPAYGGATCVGDFSESKPCNEGYCPIDGGFSDWNLWTTCSVTCEDGTKTRTRTCNNPLPQYGGAACSGSTDESLPCILGPCPIDGGFTSWSTWGSCSSTCGSGTMSRTRSCSNPEPQHGGADCSGQTTDQEECDDRPCPIDGGFAAWNDWSTCSVTCDDGEQTRTRTCNNPKPQYGGVACSGDMVDIMSCNVAECPVDGGFSIWSDWTTCSVTCSEGSIARSRTCTNPVPAHGGLDCSGDVTETLSCDNGPCPIDGVYTEWNAWGACSKTCGSGIETRSRDCTNPAPQNGGQDCIGEAIESRDCDIALCSGELGFSEWSDWSTCSYSCGGGTRSRSRSCVDISSGCDGDTSETRECNTVLCPVDGGFADWSQWTTCSVTCDGGSQTRSRVCTNPAPAHGGADCVGNAIEAESCNETPCPSDGIWLSWSQWSTCSSTCGSDTRVRTRTCSDQQNGGQTCHGSSTQEEECVLPQCPVNGYWTNWDNWDTCTVTCSGGTRDRIRSCIEPQYGGNYCSGLAVETENCETESCPVDGYWTDWSVWNTCSVTCGEGTRIRIRTCVQPESGGQDCIGQATMSESCGTESCPVNGFWTEWGEWNQCSITCGGGTRDRSRACVQPQYGGLTCPDEDTLQVEGCGTANCPVNGVWITWTAWSLCSVTCNGGTRVRTRTCSPPQYGGLECTGHTSEVTVCGMDVCPKIHGSWTEWSDWAICTMTCGFGERSRARSCTQPIPQWGGDYCVGQHIQTEYCKINTCPVDGVWSTWSNWMPCYNMTSLECTEDVCKCGRGVTVRKRACDNPTPQHGGKLCEGNTTEFKNCNVPCFNIQCNAQDSSGCQIVFNAPSTQGKSTAHAFDGMSTIFLLIIIWLQKWLLYSKLSIVLY